MSSFLSRSLFDSILIDKLLPGIYELSKFSPALFGFPRLVSCKFLIHMLTNLLSYLRRLFRMLFGLKEQRPKLTLSMFAFQRMVKRVLRLLSLTHRHILLRRIYTPHGRNETTIATLFIKYSTILQTQTICHLPLGSRNFFFVGCSDHLSGTQLVGQISQIFTNSGTIKENIRFMARHEINKIFLLRTNDQLFRPHLSLCPPLFILKLSYKFHLLSMRQMK